MAEQSRAAPGSQGLFESLKTLSMGLIGILQTRIELLSADVAEEREQLTTYLMSMLAAMFCIGVGVVLLAIFFVVVFWETHRLMALGGLTGFFLIVGAGLGWFTMHRARNRSQLFEASLAELSKDRQQLASGA